MKYISAVFLVLALLLSGCAGVPKKSLRDWVRQIEPFHERVYMLDFDDEGALVNPANLRAAIEEIKNSLKDKAPSGGPVKKLLILSYGWSHDREKASDVYYKSAIEYLRAAGLELSPDGVNRPLDFGEWAVVCVSWNASNGAVATAVKDLIPGQRAAEMLATVPRFVLFPFTFWSKARLADNIGYKGLNESLTVLIDESYGGDKALSPDIYLVGHSFGCRVLSALGKRYLGSVELGAHRRNVKTDDNKSEYEIPFKYISDIRGAIFFQPALSRFNLPEIEAKGNYPVVVTQSRHDHANGFLYPLANVALNSYSFTASTAFVDQLYPDSRNGFLAAGKQVMVLSFSFAWSLGALPVNYVWTQGVLLKERNIHHAGDTLAQIPLIEVPVAGIDRLFGTGGQEAYGWGNHSLGFFDLGAPFESAGRVSSVELGAGFDAPVDTGKAVDMIRNGKTGCIYVDASPWISHSALSKKIDLDSAAMDFTVGWLDPVGAHSDYNPALSLIKEVLASQISAATDDGMEFLQLKR